MSVIDMTGSAARDLFESVDPTVAGAMGEVLSLAGSSWEDLAYRARKSTEDLDLSDREAFAIWGAFIVGTLQGVQLAMKAGV